MRIAIVVMSFNRPRYLDEVCQSLANQECSVSPENIFFFQDGGFNIFSNRQYASENEAADCIKVFCSHFPNSNILPSPVNLGVALNFDRAERYVFEQMNYDAAIFLEDDMILSPSYVGIVESLLELASDNPRIGMVSAYGKGPGVDVEEQVANCDKIIEMRHNWAFGITKSFWKRRQTLVDQYVDAMRSTDYRPIFRPMRKIHRLQDAWEFKRNANSQDVIKQMATVLAGGARITTFGNYARYIGEVGLHSNPDKFARGGYQNTVLCPKAPESVSIDNSKTELIWRLQAKRLNWKHFESANYDNVVALEYAEAAFQAFKG